MNYVIMFLLISFLILIHEFGHLIAAKIMRIPIELFSIGFGPKLWSFNTGKTEYRLSSLPIGGYVLPRLESENDFFLISPYKRIVFAIGGPVANIIFAIVCLGVLNAITSGLTLYNIIAYPFIQIVEISSQILSALPMMFSNPGQISGIIGIISQGGNLISQDSSYIISLAAMLNINLALLNMLPLLPLDGGNILFCLLEGVHRSLGKLRLPLAVTGWVLLLGLMLSVSVIDIYKIAFHAAA